MAPPARTEAHDSTLLCLDRDEEGSAAIRVGLSRTGTVIPCHDLDSLLDLLQELPGATALLDTATLLDAPTSQVRRLVDFRGRHHMGLVTAQQLEDYFGGLREWGILRSFVKTPPINQYELEHFLRMVRDPLSGFGLMSYLSATIEMYNLSVATVPEKVAAIERVINHFATCGFGVHELYNVRLILEEIVNNAFFHAFRTATGEEKYSIAGFRRLEEGETVRIEYGSDSLHVGFSVTDSAGTLPISVILDKLERQMNHDGVFDESGRGLHLSRLLASRLVFNVEQGRRTQLVAIFETTPRADRPRPFVVNYLGDDRFHEWRHDPDFD